MQQIQNQAGEQVRTVQEEEEELHPDLKNMYFFHICCLFSHSGSRGAVPAAGSSPQVFLNRAAFSLYE